MHLAFKKSYIFVNSLLVNSNIIRLLLSLMYPAVICCKQYYLCVLSNSPLNMHLSYAKNVFFLKKLTKGIFVYVLEFMLNLNKMQNISTLMCKRAKHLTVQYLMIIPNEKIIVKINSCKELAHTCRRITVPQNSVICALVDCYQSVMTALFEYSGSLPWYML